MLPSPKNTIGLVENRVQLDHTGQTSVSGIYVVGDLTGVPLLKNALQTGCHVIDEIAKNISVAFYREYIIWPARHMDKGDE